MDTLREHLSRIGKNGGLAKTERKRLASIENLKQANKRRIDSARAKRLAKVQSSA